MGGASAGTGTIDVINPATEQSIGTLAMGSEADANTAVAAAKAALPAYGVTSKADRIVLLQRQDP